MKKSDGRKNNKGHKGKAGRKEIEDKAVPVTVYIKKSRILAIGGIEQARIKAQIALQ